MATPDDDQTQTPAPSGGAPVDYGALVQQFMAPPPQVEPDTTPAQGGWHGLLGRIGLALAGGTVTDAMSPAQKERAGIRALGDFGTSLMAGSGYYPGKPMFGGLAEGFQGAERSERGSEEQVASQLAARQSYLQTQQQQQLERLKMALPLLRAQAAGNIPNTLLGGGPAVPGTATGSGRPGTIAPPAPAYGAGGPNAVPVPAEYMPYFQAAAKRTGVPVDLLIAQARQESGFNPGATGQGGEIGVMQIHPKTATNPGYGLTGVQNADVLRDPATNINFGADYLAARAKAVGADLTTPQGQALGLTAYNGGGDPNYVANVTRYMPKPGGTQFAGPGVPAGGPGAPPGGPAPAVPVAPPGGAPAVAPGAPGAAPPVQPAPAPGRMTFEQFQAAHPIQIDPSSYAVTPPDLTQAKAAQVEAARQLSLARQGISGDPNKSLADYNTATQALNKLQQDAQAKSLELRQAAEKNALDTQRQLYDQEMTRQQQAELKAQELAAVAAENQKNRDADIRKAELGAGYTAQQKQADADIDIAKNDLTERTADAQKAGRVIPILQQMQGQIGHLPDGFIGGLLARYDTTGDMTGILAKMGVVDPAKATAAQMLIAARNYLSIEMKPAATGSLRVAEMDKLQSFTPGQLQTPQAQQEMAARLIAYQKRIQDERDFASNYFGRSSDSNNPNSPRVYDNRGLDKAMNAPARYDQNGVVTGGGLGPVVPEPPPANASDAEHRAYLAYINRNLAPGSPYQEWEPKRNEDGSLALDANRRPIPQRVTKLKAYQ